MFLSYEKIPSNAGHNISCMKYNAEILGRKNAFTCSQFSLKISLEIGCKKDEFSFIHLSESLNATLSTDCFQELLSVKPNDKKKLRKLKFARYLVCMKSEKHLRKTN